MPRNSRGKPRSQKEEEGVVGSSSRSRSSNDEEGAPCHRDGHKPSSLGGAEPPQHVGVCQPHCKETIGRSARPSMISRARCTAYRRTDGDAVDRDHHIAELHPGLVGSPPGRNVRNGRAQFAALGHKLDSESGRAWGEIQIDRPGHQVNASVGAQQPKERLALLAGGRAGSKQSAGGASRCPQAEGRADPVRIDPD